MERVDVPSMLLGKMEDVKCAVIRAGDAGIIAGTREIDYIAKDLSLTVEKLLSDGSSFEKGDIICLVRGKPVNLIRGEDRLLAPISKASGIASAAAQATAEGGGLRIVCGGWKKIPVSYKDSLREALAVGGVKPRISDEPFIYLDKNYVRVLGGVGKAAKAASKLFPQRNITVQLRGETKKIELEAIEGACNGANILMVDTGDTRDLKRVLSTLMKLGLRESVQIAFAGGVTICQLPEIIAIGADIVDVGRAILDAPLSDFRYDILMEI